MDNRDHDKKKLNYFQHLTPQVIDKDKNTSLYISALNYAINEKSIKNIALTGSYGSGKSSILKTLEFRNPENKYLRISLASFNESENSGKSENFEKKNSRTITNKSQLESSETSKGNEGKNTNEYLERLLELSILQQIFYHVKHDQIPDSRFKRIIKLDSNALLDFQIAGVIWILSGWYLFFPLSLSFGSIKLFDSNILKFAALFLFLVGLAKLLGHFRRVYNNSKLNKLNIQSGEVEIDQEVDQSILNKHIDEIIYFFEATSFNVVIIEDLDRFNNTAIFTKLREINLIINNSLQINRKINFIYAVRDDIFEDSHRTKFFDFFIPVVPVSDPSNATDLLIKNFKNLDEDSIPDEDFLSDVASFIPDMRFLNNVFNEYLLYESTIKTPLNPDKRLAIILYKNQYPKDFILLQKGKGMLHSILRSRNSLVQLYTEKITNDIKKTKEKIKHLESDLSIQEDQLRSIYINAIQNDVSNSVGIKVNNSFLKYQSLFIKENFDKIPKDIPLRHRTTQSNIGSSHTYFNEVDGKSMDDIEKKVNPNLSYEERLNQLKNKSTENHYYGVLKKQERERDQLRYLSLGQLLNGSKETTVFGEFQQDELVIYLLKNEYIDEDYISYISYFYEGQIAQSDNEFYQSVLANQPFSFDYQLLRTSNLIQKIAPRYFLTEAILNLNLVDHIFEESSNFQNRKKLIINQLSNQTDISEKFIIFYLKNGKFPDRLLISIYQLWPNVWEYLIKKQDQIDLNQNLFILLNNVDIDTLINTLNSSGIQKYILNNSEILLVFENIHTKKIKRLISETPILFENLKYSKKEELNSLFDYILSSGHWLFTESMALTAYQFYEDPSCTYEKFAKSPYSNLIKIEKLKEKIQKGIIGFTQKLLLTKNTIEETPSSFLELVNNSDIPIELREKIIEKQDLNFKIIYIEEVENVHIQKYLLVYGKVNPNWANVVHYYNEVKKIDKHLLSFLNNFSKILSQDKSELINGDSFKNELLISDGLEIEAYKSLIPKFFNKPFNTTNYTKLSEDKIDFLMNIGILSIDSEMFDILKENFEGSEQRLIESNPQKFIKKLPEISLDETDINYIILSEKLSEDVKFQTIKLNISKIEYLSKSVVNNLIEVLLKRSVLSLGNQAIYHLIESAQSDSKAIEILLHYESELDTEGVRQAILKLPQKYHKLLKPRKRLEPTKTKVNIDFGYLLEKHKIAKLKIKEKTVVFTGKF